MISASVASQAAVADVVQNRFVEQFGLLCYQRDARTQILGRDVAERPRRRIALRPVVGS